MFPTSSEIITRFTNQSPKCQRISLESNILFGPFALKYAHNHLIALIKAPSTNRQLGNTEIYK